MSRQLKVLSLVTDAYGGTGGIAQYNRDMIEAMTLHPSIEEVTVIPRVISRELSPVPPRVVHLTEAANSKVAFLRTLNTVSARGEYDLVVCGHINLLPVAFPAARRLGAGLILLTYGTEVWEKKNPFLRRLVSRVDAIASISRLTRDRMRTWAHFNDEASFILPNAIDLDAFDRRLEKVPNYELKGKPVLLTLGRMEAAEKGKGFDELIEAMPELTGKYPGLMYYAAGDGNDSPRLRAKARELGVEQHVVFPGYIREEDKPALFRAADVYVMPGRLEGFGYVFLEALAAGTPVIGSTLDASGEAMMDGKWGLLVDPGDRTALIEAVGAVLANPEVPPRSDLEYFSISNFKTRTHVMLNSVLARTQNNR